MKLIKPSFEILDQQPGLEGIYKQIELAGRTCYKSEDKITEDSAKGFVERMVKSGHGAMLEHGTIYLAIPISEWRCIDDYRDSYISNPYSGVNDSLVDWENNEGTVYITTNLRVLVENMWTDDLKYLCEPTEYHNKRVTVKFTCDRGVSHEFVRHRVFSFAQESTRYCNYSKDKFGNELTFIIPCWLDIPETHTEDTKKWLAIQSKSNDIGHFISSCHRAQEDYNRFIQMGWKAQQARAILPNSLKTELVMTGFVSDWKHFFFLRDAVSAHPQARELAEPLHSTFIQRGFITE